VSRALRIAAPLAVIAGLLGFWEWAVAAWGIRPIVLPAPSAIWAAALKDWGLLSGAALETLRTTLIAFFLAAASGVALALVFSWSRLAEAALSPLAVALQVTPVVAIAPLVNVWVQFDTALSTLILAWIVAFFPILAAANAGLRAADANLKDLFRLHRAGRWTTFLRLQLPSAAPYLMTGFKTAGGLALIGAVVAEMAAGSGEAYGLARLIFDAGANLRIARLFAALGLLAVIGIAIFAALTLAERAVLGRWHESAR
jgi:NitT/TauT family transport system permease protein